MQLKITTILVVHLILLHNLWTNARFNRLEVTDNTSNQIQSQIIGPIVNDIAINEALITKTDQVCIGSDENIINNFVTGGTVNIL